MTPSTAAAALPVATPDLTAETVAMLDTIEPEETTPIVQAPLLPLVPFFFRSSPPIDDPRTAVEILDEIRRIIEHHEAEGDAPAALPPEEPAEAEYARTIHARRALERAIDHGTALLAALGLPRLVMADFVALDPIAIGDALDMAISHLDALDAPAEDLEDEDADEDDDPLEKVGDDELDLGWAANVSQLALGHNTADGDETALERHGKGFVRSGPDDAEDDDSGGAGQHDEPPCAYRAVLRDLGRQVAHG